MTAPLSEPKAAPKAPDTLPHVALLGNPNTGKTTLFNRLSGLRHKSANFPGTTLEARLGTMSGPDRAVLVDLPGVYSLELDQSESEICRSVLAGTIGPRGETAEAPDAVLIVADAMNLPRSLMLVGEALRRRLPVVVAVNMIDLARKRGIHIDETKLAELLDCPVACVCARTGEGFDALREAVTNARVSSLGAPPTETETRAWADDIYATVTEGDQTLAEDRLTDRLDRVATHPLLGLGVFAVVMAGLFWVVFKLAAYPMEWIDLIFSVVGGAVESILPSGLISDLLVGGIVGGVGATVIFLPQICLLFFIISLLEDTGYLARAAFVADRVLRPFGLPGHAFVPLLSSHACALPGIMACRSIPDRKQRLASILVAPFMSCTARIPVYVLLASLLFPGKPAMAALAMVACYALGAVAGLGSALLVRRTLLKGRTIPMAMELPSYKWPSIKTALLTTWDRGLIFIKNAGTVILAIVIVLWWLESFPRVDPPADVQNLREQGEAIVESRGPDDLHAQELIALADELESSHAKANSFAGMIGRGVQPIFAPLGYDWQLTVGVVTSFAAREVFVSTMAVILTGSDDAEDEGIFEQLATARRSDNTTLVFTTATSWSLLVYFVLAMQCLPTLAVTAREAGGIRWALLQLAWMQGVAYIAALAVYQIAIAAGLS